MSWLQQQHRVERLAIRATNNARQMQRIRWQISQKLYGRLQQPGSLAWAFAMGILLGANRSGESIVYDGFSIFRWFNAGATVWSFLFAIPPAERDVLK